MDLVVLADGLDLFILTDDIRDRGNLLSLILTKDNFR
jgi:hypothetical protein